MLAKRWMVVLLLLAPLLSNGCAARNSNAMRAWEGRHYSDLIASWGPPQQVFDDGAGGRMLIWTSSRSYTTPGKSETQADGNATIYDDYIWGSARSDTTYTPPQTHGSKAYRVFWINRRGYIYRWASKGL